MRHRSVLTASLIMMAGFLVAGGPPALAVSSGTAASAVPAASATLAPVGAWGTATAVPGTSTANGAEVAAVSCARQGVCTALVNTGLNTANHLASYVVTERGGSWGPAVPIPGLTKIAPAGLTAVTGLSCPRSGYCLVTGIYAYGTGDNSVGGFTIWESNGTWGTPAKIRGLSKLSTAGLALTTEVACSSTITCVVSGIYGTGSSANPNVSTFIAEELHGTWKPAIQVPGLPKPSSGNGIGPAALSCPSPGNCVLGLSGPPFGVAVGVGGTGSPPPPPTAIRGALRLTGRDLLRSLPAIRSFTRTAATSGEQVRVAVETGGAWQKAQVVGPSVSASDFVGITGFACPAAGKCVLAGIALTTGTSSSGGFSFVVTQSGKTWSTRVKFTSIGIMALACPAVGGCVAGGLDTKGVAAIVQEKSGTWGKPKELPGATALSHGTAKAQESEVDFLACPSAGNCSIGGGYSWNINSNNPSDEIFAGGEANGTWAPVKVPAGIAALNTGLADSFTGLSCSSAANCAAGGFYADPSGNLGAFIIAETPVP